MKVSISSKLLAVIVNPPKSSIQRISDGRVMFFKNSYYGTSHSQPLLEYASDTNNLAPAETTLIRTLSAKVVSSENTIEHSTMQQTESLSNKSTLSNSLPKQVGSKMMENQNTLPSLSRFVDAKVLNSKNIMAFSFFISGMLLMFYFVHLA